MNYEQFDMGGEKEAKVILKEKILISLKKSPKNAEELIQDLNLDRYANMSVAALCNSLRRDNKLQSIKLGKVIYYGLKEEDRFKEVQNEV